MIYYIDDENETNENSTTYNIVSNLTKNLNNASNTFGSTIRKLKNPSWSEYLLVFWVFSMFFDEIFQVN